MKTTLAIFVSAAQVSRSLASTICPNSCSGHGSCDATRECTCFNGFSGADCSLRECLSGAAWFAPPSATDVAHVEEYECSNAGTCNRDTGMCECDDLFEGAACERLQCPTGGTGLACSGHGRCLTMSQIAEDRNDFSTLVETTYTGIWDADRVQGCACDTDWSGHDCSVRTCISGDDPMTGGQVDEIQDIGCQCGSGECAGTFRLSFRGQLTTALGPDADEAALETALEDLSSINDVTVTFASAQGICDPTNTATVTFLTEHGDLPPIRVGYNGLTSNTPGTDFLTVTETQTGTKEDLECNGRGACSTTTGVCTCDALFESSDGQGNAGYLGDCGYTSNSSIDCPVDALDGTCSGHGKCNEVTDQCECYDDYSGFSCQLRSCPLGVAWFDEATDTDTAHAEAECSNRGSCDRVSGTCTCDSGFEGSACERMTCPGSGSGTACNGHGRCRSLYAMGLFRKVNGVSTPTTYGSIPGAVETWDADKIQGCDCDVHYHEYPDGISGDVTDWTGYDCSLRTCPTGDTPQNAATSIPEVQTVTCETTDDSTAEFTLSFRDETTATIAGNADAATVEAALEALPTIGDVTVALTDDAQNACGDGSQTMTVTFLSELGTLPELVGAAVTNVDDISVLVSNTSTTQDLECANKGLCNRDTGLCECFESFVSSDGFGNRGTRGDCGYQDRSYTP